VNEKGNQVRDGGTRAKDMHEAPGAYVLQAMGKTADLLPFLVAHLLTQRDMVSIRRCKRRLCDGYVVIDLNKRGRRQEYCRPSCVALEKEEAKLERLEPERAKRRDAANKARPEWKKALAWRPLTAGGSKGSGKQ